MLKSSALLPIEQAFELLSSGGLAFLAQLIVKCSLYYNYTLMLCFVVAEEIAERVV